MRTLARLLHLASMAALVLGGSAVAQRPPVVLAASIGDDGAEAVLPQSWSAVVSAVACARAADGAVTLAPATGSWATSARAVFVDAAGQPAAAPATATGPASTVTLDLAGTACTSAWTWTLAPDATAALAPGDYALSVRLDVAGIADPVISPPVVVRVVPAPVAPTPDEIAEREVRMADVETAQGRTEAALAALDGVVAARPGHVGARLRQGHLLAEAGRVVEAVLAVDAALAALPDSVWAQGELPEGLLEAKGTYLHAVEAATSFVVTREPKAPAHPAAGRGADWAFGLDGIQGRSPILRIGSAYTFRLAGVPADAPFGLSVDEAGAVPYTAGVEGGPASGDGVVTFTPGPDAPAVLYYGSPSAPSAGWRLYVEPAEGGATPVEPGAPPTAAALTLSAPAPNPTAGRAEMSLSAVASGPVAVEAFDLLGRRVATLYDGPATAGQDVRVAFETAGLPPAVYVVRATSSGATATRRLTVVR